MAWNQISMMAPDEDMGDPEPTEDDAMAQVCRAEYCVMLAVAGSDWCAAHQQAPPLHNLENAKQWRRRVAQERAARKREAARVAASDAAMAKRRGGA